MPNPSFALNWALLASQPMEWPRAGMPTSPHGFLLPPPSSIPSRLPLTTYHKTICMPRTPKYFCMRGSPYSPLDFWKSAITLKASKVHGHHQSASLSRVTPAVCLSGWVEACCEIDPGLASTPNLKIFSNRVLLWLLVVNIQYYSLNLNAEQGVIFE